MTTALAPAPTETARGEVTALCAITGVSDEVGDVIIPGAFRRTLGKIRPKIVRDHDWKRPIGRCTEVAELLPGDRRLPAVTADGTPWPAEAGALLVHGLLNMSNPDGPTPSSRSGSTATRAPGPSGTRSGRLCAATGSATSVISTCTRWGRR